jgi:hypothetical protein
MEIASEITGKINAMLQNDLLNRQKKFGACSVCLRQLTITSTNVIRSHGLNGQCAGSGHAPVDGSVTAQQSSSSMVTTDSQQINCAAVDNTGREALTLLDSIVEARSQVLKYIPKASRVLAAGKLSTVLDRVVADPSCIDTWRQFLLFAYSCFGVSARGGKKHRSSLATKVNKLLSDYLSDRSVNDHTTQVSSSSRKKKSVVIDSGMQNLAARVAAKIEEGDVRGAVRLTASNDTLAAYDDDTVAALRQLHPSRTTPTCDLPHPPVDNVPALKLSENDIVAAIKSFLAGSAGGLDGLRPQHLKDMTGPVTGIAGQRLIVSLTEFCNMCLAGQVPPAIRPILYGASLCALTKKGGGVRPIAVGSTFRRLVAKAACRTVREEVAIKLAPAQLGFGIHQGAEAAAHAARSFLSNLTDGQALLKIDFTNAFNTLRRDRMLLVIREELPELFPFISSCYSGQSFLRFGKYTLMSDEGPQQGDPLGPLLFCLTVMALVKRIKSQCNIWYMDDGAIGDNVDALLSDFRMLMDESRKLGLIINVTKCEIITDNVEVLQKFRDVAPDIKHVKTAAAMLLGAPIGSEQSVDDVLKAKLEELRRLSNRLSLLHAHDALFLLKNCFSIPKLMFTLRGAPCYSRV